MPAPFSPHSVEMAPIRTVRFSRRAASEAERARGWWLANRDKAPTAFDDDVAGLVDALEVHADGVGIPARGYDGIRRVYLERVRYYVYFRILASRSLVEILAVWHGSRGRRPKLR